MKLERKITYETPEGTFNGTIVSAVIFESFKNGQPKENLRITVSLDPFPDDLLHDYRVRVDYYGGAQEELITDLYRLLGGDVVKLTDVDGNILPEKLVLLEGRRVKVFVVHEHHGSYPVAFRKATNMRPLKEAA